MARWSESDKEVKAGRMSEKPTLLGELPEARQLAKIFDISEERGKQIRAIGDFPNRP